MIWTKQLTMLYICHYIWSELPFSFLNTINYKQLIGLHRWFLESFFVPLSTMQSIQMFLAYSFWWDADLYKPLLISQYKHKCCQDNLKPFTLKSKICFTFVESLLMICLLTHFKWKSFFYLSLCVHAQINGNFLTFQWFICYMDCSFLQEVLVNRKVGG